MPGRSLWVTKNFRVVETLGGFGDGPEARRPPRTGEALGTANFSLTLGNDNKSEAELGRLQDQLMSCTRGSGLSTSSPDRAQTADASPHDNSCDTRPDHTLGSKVVTLPVAGALRFVFMGSFSRAGVTSDWRKGQCDSHRTVGLAA